MSHRNDRTRRHRGRVSYAHDRTRPSPDLITTGRRKRADQKTLQLCRQVVRALSGGLAGNDPEDDAIRDLAVHSVLPAPDASRLLVNVYLAAPPPHAPADVIYDRLALAAGRLRSEVAAVIVRKRAPELSFHLLPATPGEVPPCE